MSTWDKLFKIGPSKIRGRQPLKNLNEYDLLRQTISLEGCLPQIFLGPLLNTLTHMKGKEILAPQQHRIIQEARFSDESLWKALEKLIKTF